MEKRVKCTTSKTKNDDYEDDDRKRRRSLVGVKREWEEKEEEEEDAAAAVWPSYEDGFCWPYCWWWSWPVVFSSFAAAPKLHWTLLSGSQCQWLVAFV